jgi:hypothetical protein
MVAGGIVALIATYLYPSLTDYFGRISLSGTRKGTIEKNLN